MELNIPPLEELWVYKLMVNRRKIVYFWLVLKIYIFGIKIRLFFKSFFASMKPIRIAYVVLLNYAQLI